MYIFSNDTMYIRILFAFLLFSVVYVICDENFQMNIKNMTEHEKVNKSRSRTETNPIKREMRKYLRECGADVSDEVSSETEEEKPSEEQRAQWAYETKNRNNRKNKGTYPETYGDSNAKNSDEDCDDDSDTGSDRNHHKGKRKMYTNSQLVELGSTLDSNFENYRDRNDRRGHKNKQNSDYEEDSDEDGGCNDNKNKHGNNRHNNRNNHGNRNRGSNKRGGSNGYGNSQYGNEDYGYDPYAHRYGEVDNFGTYGGWGDTRGYNFYGSRLIRRNNTKSKIIKRNAQSGRDEDIQCISQCVFGYMAMLDDNRVPSETEVLRYLQNNIQNSDIRIRLVREARRCFAMLATTDGEDGCEFSKSLARCLHLDIEEK